MGSSYCPGNSKVSRPVKRRHRGTIFVVVRQESLLVMDSFRTLERAEEMVGVYEQQTIEKYGQNIYTFSIQTSCYYDE